jgi:hypothetical protein
MDIVAKVAPMAAIQEGPDGIQGFAGGLGNGGHRQRPSCFGVFA